MTEPPHVWDRLSTETLESYASFLAYVALGARRSVREAARQHNANATPSSAEVTTMRRWLAWSSRHKWVSRANARDAWLAQVSDEQIVVNLKACMLALSTKAHGFLTANDSSDFLRAARALSLHFPPIQRVADVSERIEDLSDLSDATLEEMRAVRDRDPARQSNEK